MNALTLHNLARVTQGTLVSSCRLCYNPAQDMRLHHMETVNRSLLPDFSHQEGQFSSAFSILRNAIAQRAFPSAALAITHRGRLIALKALGEFVYETDLEGAPSLSLPFLEQQGRDFEVQPSTLFDLASLTKVVATTTMAAILYERGLLQLDVPVVDAVPEFLSDSSGAVDPRRRTVTFRMLLAHSSGLPAYEKLFLRCHTREQLLHAAFTIGLTADPAVRAEYSDIGFIILGTALERIAGEPLDRFCQREIFAPLGMGNTLFHPPAELRPKIPPTADERLCGADTPVRAQRESHWLPSGSPVSSASHPRSTFRDRIIQGEVQDENAFVLGQVAGHAGLFSTAEDLALLAHSMLNKSGPILRRQTISLFTQRQSSPANTSRALGWDTPSRPSQSGKYFGARSFGHLGYTGTSLWIDPDRELSVALLTNRTWPDGSNQAIKRVRPRFHDAVIEALEAR
jgi:serine-type D-Ala-D-Ala carboxypeptidase